MAEGDAVGRPRLSRKRGFSEDRNLWTHSQTRRAVASIPANIAEGQGRRLAGEYRQFLGNARGSLSELDTHLELAARLGYLGAESHSQLLDQLAEVGRLLNGLMRSTS